MTGDVAIVKTWNGMVGRLEQFFKDAIELAKAKPYKDDAYIEGYTAGLKQGLDIIKRLRISENRNMTTPDVYH